MVRVSTREEILSAAGQLFASVGYKGTSLQDIAAEIGCSKATLLYHFATKEMILATLVAPPVRDLATLTEAITDLSTVDAQTQAIEGFVDIVLTYRREIALIFHDLPYLLHGPSFADVKGLTEQLARAMTAGSTEPAALLGVKTIMAGIALVAVDPLEQDGDELRSALIAVARKALVTGD